MHEDKCLGSGEQEGPQMSSIPWSEVTSDSGKKSPKEQHALFNASELLLCHNLELSFSTLPNPRNSYSSFRAQLKCPSTFKPPLITLYPHIPTLPIHHQDRQSLPNPFTVLRNPYVYLSHWIRYSFSMGALFALVQDPQCKA